MKKQNKEVLTIILFLVVLMAIFLANSSIFKGDIEKVCLSRCFNVEVADNDAERIMGLMNRSNLGENSGMLFIFDKEGRYPFWMKDTLIDLDIIWLDKDMKVVEIVTAYSCTSNKCPIYGGNRDALYVLEVNSGLASNIGIHVGERARFE